MLEGTGSPENALDEVQVRQIVRKGVPFDLIAGKRVLVLTPDSTRTSPLDMMFRVLVDHIGDKVEQLDFMIALGTHQPMKNDEILELYGITADEHAEKYSQIGLYNHRWDLPGTLETIGRISGEDISEMTDGQFDKGVDVAINKTLFDYDLVLILGHVFPHEVAGFSGGNTYLFPGISGGELLHYTHWLGAVVTCWESIGIKDTLVRRAINRAAELVSVPRHMLAMVVKPTNELAGLYVGDVDKAWNAAADLSQQLHIRHEENAFHTVIGTASEMCDELWVAGKVMCKLEPVVADGGKLIIYGKHITEVSRTWGKDIEKIGYHVRDYFLKRMEQFTDVPLGVLAHSTHVRGVGSFEDGKESPRIEVVLATSIPEEVCHKIGLGYMNPESINLNDYRDKESEGVLLVENAGEVLYRLNSDKRY